MANTGFFRERRTDILVGMAFLVFCNTGVVLSGKYRLDPMYNAPWRGFKLLKSCISEQEESQWNPYTRGVTVGDISILIGGEAGDGIKAGGRNIARLLSRWGYHVFVYDDYQSLIRGGHNFNVIRAAEEKVLAHKDKIDVLVALNQETLSRHRRRLRQNGVILYDSDQVEVEDGVGIPFSSIVKEAGGIPGMKSTAAMGALAGLFSIDWSVLESAITDTQNKVELNLKIARVSFEQAGTSSLTLERPDQEVLALATGNEAIALGAVQAGLSMYIAYPMTPSSGILHYLAAQEEKLGVVTVHPESEIAVAVMALGAAYAGARTMVGTSGGGFALMTEALSLAGQAEVPVVFVECQRAGPSTGVPTYSMQGDLSFVLNAGHGDFTRVVVAPGDAEQAFSLSGLALNLAWRNQIPTFVLSDKHLSESIFSFTPDVDGVTEARPLLWDGREDYRRYLDTETGISPLAFPGNPNAVVKASSYEHDEYGLTTEEAEKVARMQRKRARKKKALLEDLSRHQQVKVYGDSRAKTALVCWGSSKGACAEAAQALGLRMVQPLVLEPFPAESFRTALSGVEKIIDVEANATGQFARLLACQGLHVHRKLLRFDARPFTADELTEQIKEVIS